MVGIVSTGIGSGLDVSGLVQQLLAAEATPAETRFATKEAGVLAKISGYSSIQSALTVFQGAVNQLETTDNLLGRKVELAENDFFTASASETASPAEFDVEVRSLASAQKLASAPYSSSQDAVGDGQLTITSGDNAFVVFIDSSANTLADIQDAINQNPDNTSVRATIVTSDAGATLSISALETGLVNEISIAAAGGDGGLSALTYDSATSSGSLTEVRQAADASVFIDGLEVTASTNTITDAVEGVTLALTSAGPGEENRVNVAYDEQQLKTRLQSFVDAYNDLVDVFQTQTNFDADTGAAAALLGDTTLRTITSQLRNTFGAINTDVSTGPYDSLASLGITLDIEGKASLDAERLDAAIADDFLAIGQIFTSANGLAIQFGDRVENYLASDGALNTRTEGLNQTIDDINDQRERLNERLITIEARLLRQFNALDSLVSQLTNTSSFLSQQLQSLPTANNNG